MGRAIARTCLPRVREGDRVSRFEEGQGGVLRPVELALYLENSGEALLRLLVIRCFAGMRQSEILRVTWDDVGRRDCVRAA